MVPKFFWYCTILKYDRKSKVPKQLNIGISKFSCNLDLRNTTFFYNLYNFYCVQIILMKSMQSFEFLKFLEFLVQFVREQLANHAEDSINLLHSLVLILFKTENPKNKMPKNWSINFQK